MYRRALLAGVVMLLAAFGASSRPLHSGSTTISTVKSFCPELPADCCRTVFSGGCRLCVQTGCF
jgi:hypothetical protein